LGNLVNYLVFFSLIRIFAPFLNDDHMFFEDISAEVILFFMLYGGSAVAALIACIYLCVRRGNAFAPDITPPVSLRRWAAAFYAVAFLGHIWWFFFYIYSCDIHSIGYLVVAELDCVGLLTTIAGTLLAMLQDRRRPVWPLVAATIPFPVLLVLHLVYPDSHFWGIAVTYILLLYALFSVYMVFSVRQYGRWLRDNYADLEHKEVWMSHVLVIVILILIITYGFDDGNMFVSYLVQVTDLALTGLLLWRVETLPQLNSILVEEACAPSFQETTQVSGSPLATVGAQNPDSPSPSQQSPAIPSEEIEQLLAERFVDTQLYLQHDLTLQQLSQTIGINRSYLSLYFSSLGTNYNAYINDLRINHFMRLYREAVQTRHPIPARRLASASGYRSYSTFSLAFKQRTGQSVTAWMRKSD